MKLFFVEGNIGTGKSTFLRMLQEMYPEKVQVIYEPVDVWSSIKDADGTNMLDYFYKNPHRYAYTFQNLAFISRIEKLKEIDMTKEFVFIERSIWSDKNVFASNCLDTGLMSEMEFAIYMKWFNWMEELVDSKVPNRNFIYLKSSTQTCSSRIEQRARPEENKISLDYLSKLELKHDQWLKYEKNVMTINSSGNYKDDPSMFAELVKPIFAYKKQPDLQTFVETAARDLLRSAVKRFLD